MREQINYKTSADLLKPIASNPRSWSSCSLKTIINILSA